MMSSANIKAVIDLLNEAMELLKGQMVPTDNQLTTNFKLSEFLQAATPTQEQLRNLHELAANLQVLRARLNAPIRINRGLSTPAENEAAGGAKNSKHLTGEAADIAVTGHTPAQVKAVIEELIAAGKMSEGGLSAYATHVHYDIRKTKTRW
jgi:uncharacterized protein YcbK (DUF882 family)